MSSGKSANYFAPRSALFVPHSERGSELRPSYQFASDGRKVGTDERGFRLTGSVAAEGRGTKVAVVGGSGVFALNVSDEESAATHLQQMLNQSTRTFHVINAGVPGYNLWHSASRFREKLAPLRPDVVIVHTGWEEISYVISTDPMRDAFLPRPVPTWFQRLLSGSAVHGLVFERQSLAASFVPPLAAKATADGLQTLTNALAEIRDAVGGKAKLILSSQCTALHDASERSLRERVTPNAAAFERVVSTAVDIRDTIRDYAADNDLNFVDAYDAIAPNTTNFSDPANLTPAGERQLAILWLRAVHQVLSE